MDPKLLLVPLAGFLLFSLLSVDVPLVQHYVPELSNRWQYVRYVDVVFPSTHPLPVVVLLPLPDDDNFWAHIRPDGADIRVTVGTGADERVLPSMLYQFDPEDREGYVAVLTEVPSTRMRFRLYYGNPDAVMPEPFAEIRSGQFYAFYNDFSPDHWIAVRANGDEARECVFQSNRIVLTKNFPSLACAVKYWKEVPRAEGILRLSLYFSNSVGDGLVVWLGRDFSSGFVPMTRQYLGFRDANGSHVTDGYGIEVDLYQNQDLGDPSYDHYALIRDVNDHIVYKRKYGSGSYYVEIRFNGDTYSVRTSNGWLFQNRPLDFSLPMPLIVSASTGGQYTEMRLYGFYFKYNKVSPDYVLYSDEMLPPQLPSVSIISPSEVVSDSTVDIRVRFDDPNNDVNYAEVILDGNSIYYGASPAVPFDFHTVITLPDGNHTLVARIVDDENLSAEDTLEFVVDTVPPELNASLSTEGNVVAVDVNVWDATTSVSCGYLLDNNGPFPVDCNSTFSLELNVELCHVLTVYAVDAADRYASRAFYLCPERVVERTVYVPAPSSGGGFRVVSEHEVEAEGIRDLNEQVSNIPVQQASPFASRSSLAVFALIVAAFVILAISRAR